MSRAFTVPPSYTLDVSALRKDGFFAPGIDRWWRQEWRRSDRVVLDIQYRRIEDDGVPTGIQVRYRAKGDQLDYVIRFAHTQCNYGGSRPWLVCPIGQSGKCPKRARILYFPLNGVLIGCRHCLGLDYVSQKLRKSPLYHTLLKPFRVFDAVEAVALRTNSEDALRRMVRDIAPLGDLRVDEVPDFE